MDPSDCEAPISRNREAAPAGKPVAQRLEKYGFYRRASGALQQHLVSIARAVELPEGQFVFRKGESLGHIALVSRGSVRVFMTGDNGREITLYHVGRGESCPINLLGILMHQPALADAQVLSDVEGVAILGGDFAALARSETVISQFVYEALAIRLTDVFAKLDQIAFQHVDRRIVEYLHHRFQDLPPETPRIRVTHEQIANEIGSAREVVTRLLKSFEKSGMLQLGRGSIELTDPARLFDDSSSS